MKTIPNTTNIFLCGEKYSKLQSYGEASSKNKSQYTQAIQSNTGHQFGNTKGWTITLLKEIFHIPQLDKDTERIG